MKFTLFLHFSKQLRKQLSNNGLQKNVTFVFANVTMKTYLFQQSSVHRAR